MLFKSVRKRGSPFSSLIKPPLIANFRAFLLASFNETPLIDGMTGRPLRLELFHFCEASFGQWQFVRLKSLLKFSGVCASSNFCISYLSHVELKKWKSAHIRSHRKLKSIQEMKLLLIKLYLLSLRVPCKKGKALSFKARSQQLLEDTAASSAYNWARCGERGNKRRSKPLMGLINRGGLVIPSDIFLSVHNIWNFHFFYPFLCLSQ